MSEGTLEELERQRARWWATVSSGDLDGYLALFAEDAVWVTPELDEIVGRQAIRAWLEPVFAQFDYELTITVADVRVAGSLGIERARFVSRMTPKPPSLRPLPVTPPPSPEPAAVEGMDGDGDGDGVDDAARGQVPTAPAPDAAEREPRAGDEPVVAEDAAASDLPEGTEPPGATGGSDDRGATGDPAASPAPEGVDELGAREDLDAPAEPASAEEPAGAEEEDAVEAPLVPAGLDAGEDQPHEGRYLMYWRWHDDAGWLVHRYADVTGVG